MKTKEILDFLKALGFTTTKGRQLGTYSGNLRYSYIIYTSEKIQLTIKKETRIDNCSLIYRSESKHGKVDSFESRGSSGKHAYLAAYKRIIEWRFKYE